MELEGVQEQVIIGGGTAGIMLDKNEAVVNFHFNPKERDIKRVQKTRVGKLLSDDNDNLAEGIFEVANFDEVAQLTELIRCENWTGVRR